MFELLLSYTRDAEEILALPNVRQVTKHALLSHLYTHQYLLEVDRLGLRFEPYRHDGDIALEIANMIRSFRQTAAELTPSCVEVPARTTAPAEVSEGCAHRDVTYSSMELDVDAFIVRVNCRECGKSGGLIVQASDIQWL